MLKFGNTSSICILSFVTYLGGLQIGNNPPIPPSWSQHPGSSPTPTVNNNHPVEGTADRMRREQTEKLYATRLAQARVEANRLLSLATELNHELEQMDATSVSSKTAGQTDEIQKLAKSIKGKVRPL